MRRRDLLALLGGIAGMSLPARAQQSTTAPVIGFLSSGSQDTFAPFVTAFRAGLEAQRIRYNQDASVDYQWANGRYENLPALADGLVRRQVAVIAATGGAIAAQAAMKATTKIPIVFVVGFDPVLLGLVSSLARPTGNATGVSLFTTELASKRLEVVRDLLPGLPYRHSGQSGSVTTPQEVGATERGHSAAWFETQRFRGWQPE